MASYSYSFLVLSSVLTTLFLFTSARDVVDIGMKVQINSVCSRTRNPGYCNGRLNSIPGIRGANLGDLANTIIDLGTMSATNIVNQINGDLLSRATNQQRVHLQYCVGRYNFALSGLDAAGDFLGSRDYYGLNKKAVAIANVGNECENSFRSNPSAPSPLTQGNADFFNLIDILSAASYRLLHP